MQTMNVSATVGQHVQVLRSEAGWSQAELADRLGGSMGKIFDPTTITRLERGRRPVSVDELAVLAQIFGVNPLALITVRDPIRHQLDLWGHRLVVKRREIQKTKNKVEELGQDEAVQSDMRRAWSLLDTAREGGSQQAVTEALELIRDAASRIDQEDQTDYVLYAAADDLAQTLEQLGIDTDLLSRAVVAADGAPEQQRASKFVEAVLEGLTSAALD